MWMMPEAYTAGASGRVAATPMRARGAMRQSGSGTRRVASPPQSRTTRASMTQLAEGFRNTRRRPCRVGLSRMARVTGTKCTPASMACWTSIASSRVREIAMPGGNGRLAMCPRQYNRMPWYVLPSRSSMPELASALRAAAFKQPPQAFARGQADFSTSSTRSPMRARCSAPMAPAMPAPTTATSHSRGNSSGSMQALVPARPGHQEPLGPVPFETRVVQSGPGRKLACFMQCERGAHGAEAVFVHDRRARQQLRSHPRQRITRSSAYQVADEEVVAVSSKHAQQRDDACIGQVVQEQRAGDDGVVPGQRFAGHVCTEELHPFTGACGNL